MRHEGLQQAIADGTLYLSLLPFSVPIKTPMKVVPCEVTVRGADQGHLGAGDDSSGRGCVGGDEGYLSVGLTRSGRPTGERNENLQASST